MDMLIEIARNYLFSSTVGFLVFCLFQLVLFNLVLVAVALAMRRVPKSKTGNLDKAMRIFEELKMKLTVAEAEIGQLKADLQGAVARQGERGRRERREDEGQGAKSYALARNLVRRGYDAARIAGETNLPFSEVKFIMDLERLEGRSTQMN